MQSTHSEEGLWAAGLAARLRLLHANFADDAPEARQGYLREEIERSLKEVPPSRREPHLRALSEVFPAWVSASDAPVATAPGTGQPLAPEDWVAGLLELAPTLPEPARQALGAKLQQAGFGKAAAADGGLGELSPEFWKRFGINEARALNPDRTLKLLVALYEAFLTLDQNCWRLWKELNPKSIYQKELELAKQAGPYLSGDAEISSEQIRQTVERTRRLVAALINATGRASSTFARKHAATFSPEFIEDAARMEKKAFESLDGASWRKFKELHRDGGTEPALDRHVQEAFVRATEELISGRGR